VLDVLADACRNRSPTTSLDGIAHALHDLHESYSMDGANVVPVWWLVKHLRASTHLMDINTQINTKVAQAAADMQQPGLTAYFPMSDVDGDGYTADETKRRTLMRTPHMLEEHAATRVDPDSHDDRCSPRLSAHNGAR
jgi:predicted transglutaminase-like cysteine proteinase